MPALPSQPRPQAFRGTTLAWNCATPAEVDAAFAKRGGGRRAGCCGGRRRPIYGGYRGYFADPDGHVWEVVHGAGLRASPTTAG